MLSCRRIGAAQTRAVVMNMQHRTLILAPSYITTANNNKNTTLHRSSPVFQPIRFYSSNQDSNNENNKKDKPDDENNKLTPAPPDNFWEQTVKVIGGLVVALASLRILTLGVGSSLRMGPLAAPMAIGTVVTSTLHFLINRLRVPWFLAALLIISPVFAAGIYIAHRDDTADQGRVVMEASFNTLFAQTGLKPRCLQYTKPESIDSASMFVRAKTENVLVDGVKKRGMLLIRANKGSGGEWKIGLVEFEPLGSDKQIMLFKAE